MTGESKQRLDYGNAIIELREQRGMTREALASAAGISPSYLYEVERGLKRPSTDVLAQLAAAFGMLPSQVLEYIETQPPPPAERAFSASHHPIAEPGHRQRWVRRRGVHAEFAMMDHFSDPDNPTLRMLLSVARELDDDDLRALLDLANHLRAKRR